MEEPKEPTIAEMTQMLTSDSPVETPPAAPGPPAESGASTPASPSGDEKPAEKPVESQGDESQPESGTGEKVEQPKQEEEKEEKPKGKFAPKEKPESESAQKRISRLTWEKHEAERKAQAAAREAEELKKKLDAQASGKPASEVAASPDKPVASDGTFTEPEPPEPNEDDFESLSEYMQAVVAHSRKLSSWSIRKFQHEQQSAELNRERERTQAESRQKEAETQGKWREKVISYAEQNPGINEALTNVGPFLTAAGQSDFILKSDVGLEMVEYVYSHADEFADVAKSGDPMQVARVLGRLEAQLLASKPNSAPKNKPEPRGSSQLPEPPSVVGGSGNPKSGVDLADDKVSTEDWIREAKRQLSAAS